jgi:hypothetical protein
VPVFIHSCSSVSTRGCQFAHNFKKRLEFIEYHRRSSKVASTPPLDLTSRWLVALVINKN